MSSYVQTQLNTQSSSTLVPEYYPDQVVNYQHLKTYHHGTVAASESLALDFGIVGGGILLLTHGAGATLTLPALEISMGQTLEIWVQSGAIGLTITAPSGKMNGCVTHTAAGALVESEMAQTSLVLGTAASTGTYLRLFCSGLFWYVTGQSPAVAEFS